VIEKLPNTNASIISPNLAVREPSDKNIFTDAVHNWGIVISNNCPGKEQHLF